MIGVPTEPPDLRAMIARINRELAESAAQRKLLAEGNARARDRWIAPLLVAAIVLTGLVGFLAGLVTGLHIGH
jgi:hypothetical protein